VSSFVCEHCGVEAIDTPGGPYVTGCEHYPLERQALPGVPEHLVWILGEGGGKSTARPEKPPLDDAMVIYATRYAIGRMSYCVGEVVGYLLAHWDQLEPKTRIVIERDIEEALAEGRYGMEMDKQQWLRVLEQAGRQRAN
jgi:hypothetical protein